MVQLVTNQPLRSKVPQITVENPLKPGSYRFSLVVVDEAHNESQPAQLTVTVVRRVDPPPPPPPPPNRFNVAGTIRQPVSKTVVRKKTPQ